MFILQVWHGTTVFAMATAIPGGRETLSVVCHPPPFRSRTHRPPVLWKTNRNLPLCCCPTRGRFRPLRTVAVSRFVFQTANRATMAARLLHCLHGSGRADVSSASMARHDRLGYGDCHSGRSRDTLGRLPSPPLPFPHPPAACSVEDESKSASVLLPHSWAESASPNGRSK